MIRVLITGAAGMIGRKLTARLVRDGKLNGIALAAVDLADVVPCDTQSAQLPIFSQVGDLAHPDFSEELVRRRPDVIFHLAGIVSGEAESNFELGYRVNLDGTRALLEALRRATHYPRFVFTSSIAVYGAPFPETITDDFHLTPQTSYGTQKMMSEALLADYTRRGFIDGIGIRLPTICVRPGKPNKAASSFFSSIIREPLAGRPAVLPVPDTVLHTHASPASAVQFLIHAASIKSSKLGNRPNLTMPGIAVTVAEQIEALRRVAGEKAVALIRREPDNAIWAIVQNWPTRFEAKRARELGFEAEASFDEIIRLHIESEMDGRHAFS